MEIWNLSPWPGDQLNGRGDNSCSLGWTRQDETIGYVNTALLVEYALWFESLITTSRPNKNNVDHSNWLGQSSTPRTQHSTNRTFSWETFGSPSLLSGFCSCVIRIIGNKNWNKILCFLLSSPSTLAFHSRSKTFLFTWKTKQMYPILRLTSSPIAMNQRARITF